jgi:hypothetical protein
LRLRIREGWFAASQAQCEPSCLSQRSQRDEIDCVRNEVWCVGILSPQLPDPAIIAKLQEIVELRQQLLKGHQLKAQAGKAEFDGVAEIALAEARIQLARERGQADLVIAELRNPMATLDGFLEMAKKKVEVGAAGPDAVAQVRVLLLETQVRLQREQQEGKGK